MINKSLEEHVNALADYMPNGITFEGKYIQGSNFRQLLRGLCGEILNAQGLLVDLDNEYSPSSTTLFIEEWEKAIGIPDHCFSGTGTTANRRRDILVKLASLGIQTNDDFVYLASLFGYTVTVYAGKDYSSFPTSVLDYEKPYYVVVEYATTEVGFPYTFPFSFASDEYTIIECLISHLIPSNCKLMFVNV
jgi:uncharacterized protein YmfQ (DUF2313 family)